MKEPYCIVLIENIQNEKCTDGENKELLNFFNYTIEEITSTIFRTFDNPFSSNEDVAHCTLTIKQREFPDVLSKEQLLDKHISIDEEPLPVNCISVKKQLLDNHISIDEEQLPVNCISVKKQLPGNSITDENQWRSIEKQLIQNGINIEDQLNGNFLRINGIIQYGEKSLNINGRLIIDVDSGMNMEEDKNISS